MLRQQQSSESDSKLPNQLWLFEKDHDISSKGPGKKLPTVNKEETHWELQQVRQIIFFLLYFETEVFIFEIGKDKLADVCG